MRSIKRTQNALQFHHQPLGVQTLLNKSFNHLSLQTYMQEMNVGAEGKDVTWRSYSVLPCGFEVTQGEEEYLDGADEDPSQAAVKD